MYHIAANLAAAPDAGKGQRKLNHRILVLTALVVSILGCTMETDDDLDKYYESAYSETINVAASQDTIHIVLTQTGSTEQVMFEMRHSDLLGDTIQLKIDSKSGSYREEWTPKSTVTLFDDTLSVWYSYYLPPSTLKKSSSNNSIVRTENALPSYFTVEKVTVTASSAKVMTFISRYYH